MSEEEYLEFKCAPDNIAARTANNGTKGCLFSQSCSAEMFVHCKEK